jgi:iron complex transport system permease protein
MIFEYQQKSINKTRIGRTIIITGLGILLLIFGLIISVSVGAKGIGFNTIIQSLLHNSQNIDSQIIRDVRLPRAVAAALVGGFLATAGAIMQGITRNPIADPSVMGVTQGATFAIAIAFALNISTGSIGLMGFAFIGAAFSGILVYAISSNTIKGVDPIKLVLAGTAIGTLLISLASGIAMYFNLSQQLSFWMAGGLLTTNWSGIYLLVVSGLVALPAALILAPRLTILSLGEEIAISLGEKPRLIKALGLLAVILLSGSAVATAGNIGFIGLIIPQLIKRLVGPDYKRIIPCSISLGAPLLVFSDTIARMINMPYETPVGAITALIGVPFFLYFVRRDGVR